MSIEQKIAEILAESRLGEDQEGIAEQATELVKNIAEQELDEAKKKEVCEEEEIEEGIGDVAQKAVDVVKKIAGVATGTVGAATGALDGMVKGARKNYAATTEEKEMKEAKKKEMCEEEEIEEEVLTPAHSGDEPNNKKNAVTDEKSAEGGTSKKANRATQGAAAPEASHIAGMKEDIDALMNGEDLSEEFKQKATTIYEAAVTARVKTEVARINEEYEVKLQEEVEQIKEGLIEQVDGYLDYVVEQWMTQNELALEHGMKSEILEGFVSGLKDLFEEHYIDIPEEKFDVLGTMEEKIEQLEAKLNEQVATNVDMKKTLSEMKRAEIIEDACDGLTDTEVEKFTGLAEELSYEDEDSFKTKVQTIRENYFTTKAQADVKSVVTDSPVETLAETANVAPAMKAYLSVLNRK